MAWQGFGLHSIHYPPHAPRVHSETTSSSPSSSFSETRFGRRTMYPKEQEVSSSWHVEQQQEAETSGKPKTPNTVEGPEDDSSLADEEENNNQTDDMSSRVPSSPVALLETCDAMDMESRFASLTKRSRGEWISRPYRTRGEIHVTYDVEHARYEGLPDAWRTLNHQFGLPLEEVLKREVEGYETKLPAVLEMMKTCFLAHDGAYTEGVFRVAPDKTEYNAVKNAINDGSFEDCSDVHIMASLIKVCHQ